MSGRLRQNPDWMRMLTPMAAAPLAISLGGG
jgi:hypothetical protein